MREIRRMKEGRQGKTGEGMAEKRELGDVLDSWPCHRSYIPHSSGYSPCCAVWKAEKFGRAGSRSIRTMISVPLLGLSPNNALDLFLLEAGHKC